MMMLYFLQVLMTLNNLKKIKCQFLYIILKMTTFFENM